MKPETLKDFLAWKAPVRHEIIKGGLLPASQVMFIYGEYSTWKSWLAMDAAWAISTGSNWLVWKTEPSRVLIINSEISKAEYQGRWESFVIGRNVSPNGNLLIDTDIELTLDKADILARLIQWLDFHRIQTIILDNLYSSMQGDLNKNTDSKQFIDNCKKLMSHGKTVIIVAHAHQPQFTSYGDSIDSAIGGYKMFGSSYWTNFADTILETKEIKTEGYSDTIKVTPEKHRLAKFKPLTAVYQFDRQTTKFNLLV